MPLSDRLRGTSFIPSSLPPGLVLRPDILLGHNIPQPLHGVAPRVVLGTSWWNKTRQEAYRSTDYHCFSCGVHKTRAKLRQWLEGHELYEIDYAKGRAKYLETVPLCHCCHNFIHDGRLLAMLEKGEIHHSKYVTIIQHGEEVLCKAGLKRLSLVERDRLILEGELMEWSKWRLRIGRNLYQPRFKSLEEWKEHHGFNNVVG